MLPWLAGGCVREEDRPPRPTFPTDQVANTGETGRDGPTGETGEPALLNELVLGAESLWSEPGELDEQHHATVGVLADGRVAVGWTDGALWAEDGTAWVRRLTEDGVALEPPLALDAAPRAAKPDVVALPDGRALVGYQTEDGLFLSRVDLDLRTQDVVHLATRALATGNTSVDLALRADGAALAVWYDQDAAVGTYRAGALDGDLAPADLLPAVIAATVDVTAATPDVDADPAGAAVLSWLDQAWVEADDEARCTLYADRYDGDGTREWRVELADGQGPDTPRRSTAVSFPDGSSAVGWRIRAEDPIVPARGVLAFLDVAGGYLRAPFQPVDSDADDLVLTRVGDGAVWVVWTAIDDPTRGLGTVTGALVSFPGGAFVVAPVALSASATASRPHTDARALADGSWRIAVSWEEQDAAGVRSVHGRTATAR